MDYLKGFEGYLTAEKGASENTRSSYLRDVRQFLDYCAKKGIPAASATAEELEGYARHLSALGRCFPRNALRHTGRAATLFLDGHVSAQSGAALAGSMCDRGGKPRTMIRRENYFLPY